MHPKAGLHKGASIARSDFAYTQYATNLDYLYNPIMLFAILDGLDSQAARLLIYPDRFDVDADPATSKEAELLQKG